MSFTPATRADVLEVCSRVGAQYPMIAGGLIDKLIAEDDPLWAYSEKALGYLQARYADGLDEVLEAFAIVSMDFLRLQARFLQTKQYARTQSAELVSELYNDDEKMSGYYLDGLAMTYVLWPNHVRMIAFFSEHFLPRLAPGAQLVEVGVGHGLMAALAFEAVPDLRYVGVDISPSSLAYAASSLELLGVANHRWRLVQADALSGDLMRLGGDHGFDGVICCEVLEHVENPQLLLERLAECAGVTGLAFMSTVANLEAEDHVYLFDDVADIRATITGHGWIIDRDLPIVLPGAESWDPLPLNYSGVLAPAR